MMGILTEGKTPADIATKANLDTWITSAKAPFTYVLDSVDPQPGMETYFNTGRDFFILIDLKTMKVAEVVDQAAGGVTQALLDFDALLSK